MTGYLQKRYFCAYFALSTPCCDLCLPSATDWRTIFCGKLRQKGNMFGEMDSLKVRHFSSFLKIQYISPALPAPFTLPSRLLPPPSPTPPLFRPYFLVFPSFPSRFSTPSPLFSASTPLSFPDGFQCAGQSADGRPKHATKVSYFM